MTTLGEAAAHWREWFDSGDFASGAARVREALESGAEGQTADRVRVLYAAHLFAFRRGEPSVSAPNRRLTSRVSWAMFAASATG